MVGPASPAGARGIPASNYILMSELSECQPNFPLSLYAVHPVQVSGCCYGDGQLTHGHDQDKQTGYHRQPLSRQVTGQCRSFISEMLAISAQCKSISLLYAHFSLLLLVTATFCIPARPGKPGKGLGMTPPPAEMESMNCCLLQTTLLLRRSGTSCQKVSISLFYLL